VRAQSAPAILILTLLASPAVAQGDGPDDAPAEEELSPEEEIERVLEERQVTLNFPETPVAEVFTFLQDITGLNIVVDPRVDGEATITLRLRDVGLGTALNLVLEQAGLDRQVYCGTLYVAPAGTELPPPPAVPADSELGERLREQSVTLNFDATPFAEVVEFLRAVAGLDFVISRGANEALEEEPVGVTLRVRELPLYDVLTLATAPHGLRWNVEEGIVIVDAAE